MSRRTRVWIGLGSNLGDSQTILQQAWQDLGQEETITLIILSHPYVTEPVGMESEHHFLNAVGILETPLAPESLLTLLQQVERGFGRNKKTGLDGYQDRLLDLDLLYYGDQERSVSDLILPHPHIADRLFVLAPLTEIDPDCCHPLTGKSAESMQHELLQRMESGEIAFQEINRDTWR
ncbi:MAG: 2-amino-4-hydroxy-6-hydroxymethyldihydropteridine diphosphokinase [Thermodesulfobacteriota bacterium]|nr:2-amino-4-hydroxy-6-hydroxymethyldihydropteridine diphosphokinase [Thermodesulfobacteriota bacterium]